MLPWSIRAQGFKGWPADGIDNGPGHSQSQGVVKDGPASGQHLGA
jgi:hypothetical protein